jgi:hypothetical protein
MIKAPLFLDRVRSSGKRGEYISGSEQIHHNVNPTPKRKRGARRIPQRPNGLCCASARHGRPRTPSTKPRKII